MHWLRVGRLFTYGAAATTGQMRPEGHQSKWKQWYDSNSSSYNYRYYMDLSEATQKGLDGSLLRRMVYIDHAE